MVIDHDHGRTHHGALTEIDLVVSIADAFPAIMRRHLVRLVVIAPCQRLLFHCHTFHRHAFRRNGCTGGAKPGGADARAAILLSTLDAARPVLFTMIATTDRTRRRAARAHQAVTDAALLQVAIANDVPTRWHHQAVLGADGACTDGAAADARTTANALTDGACRQFVRQRMAGGAFA